ncbi:MAG: DUF2336 domain-containing protein [Rhodospirillales bacterium]|nr:DUF2336 domain-containing protein [Rhodospirillales bacterium]
MSGAAAIAAAPELPGAEAARVRRAAAPGLSLTEAAALAADPSVTVRATLAMNRAACPRIDRTLARDGDDRVRLLLGRKLAAIAPRLAAAEDDPASLSARAYSTLAGLVEDEAVRVRAAIAEILRDMPDAPRALILRLAGDAAAEVAEPVIRFSPLLSADDLLALLAGARGQALAAAIARRPELAAPVSDAIARSADSAAICALLANRSAQIREATLDALIARAGAHAEWHQPLIERPSLGAHAARALSEIVSAHLLAALSARPDLEPGLAEELRRRLAARRDRAEPAHAADDAAALAEAHAMAADGRLGEAAILATLGRGNTRAALIQLAVAAEVAVSVVDRAVTLRSAKGLVSLVWRAGFGMRLAVPVQAEAGGLAPAAVLPAGPGGGFPLAIEEMHWQIDFLTRMGK